MKYIRSASAALGLLLYCHIAMAQVTVEAVQPPVWKQFNGTKEALHPGDTLTEDMIIISGSEARVLLKLAEGSAVELGEDTSTQFPKIDASTSTFESTIDMLKGAFRFTTAAIAKSQARDISIKLPSSTIGIRGTDLWGRASDNSDFVVLIEGKIAIDHSSGEQVIMEEPTSVYRAPAGATPEALSKIAVPDLLKLAAETALIIDKPALKLDNPFELVAGSFIEAKHATARKQWLEQQGYPATISPIEIESQLFNRVTIRGINSRSDADKLALLLQEADIISDSWINKN